MSKMAHKWAGSRPNPYLLGGPQCFIAGDEIHIGPQVGTLAAYPCRPQRFKAWKQNQKWPTNGHIGYVALANWGVLNALERGTKKQSGPHAGR